MMKMATYIMERSLLLFYLVAFIGPATALKCYSCLGTDKECKLTEVTCSGSNDKCGSSLRVIKSFPFREYTVTKGCVSSTSPYRSISISPSAIVQMSLEEQTCGTDLCNNKTMPESETKENERNCYSCLSQGKDCNSETMLNMKCRGQQNQCLDIRVLGGIGEISNTQFKGCGQMNCSKSLSFSCNRSSVTVKCCDENFCNGDTGYQEPEKKLNGVECYSCNTLNGENCSPGKVTKTQCYGSLTSCFELAGIKTGDGKPTPAVLKGCATPDMCDSLVLPLLHNLRRPRVQCCSGNLCNKNFTEDNLQASGYFPGTGIQRYPTQQAAYSDHKSGVKNPQYFYNPINTGHASNNHGPAGTHISSSANDVNNGGLNSFDVFDVPTESPLSPGDSQNNLNYGVWNSNDNSGSANPTSSSSDRLNASNSDSVNNTNLPTEITQNALYNTQNRTAVYNNDSDSSVEEDDSNLNTTSQGPTNQQVAGDFNSYGSETNATGDNLGQQNQTLVDNSDQYSPTDGDSLAVSETDLFYNIDMSSEEDDSNLNTTSHGPTKQQVPSDINSYGSQTNATGDNLGQRNQTLVDNSNSTDGEIITVSETDIFYNIDTTFEEYDSNLNTTSQGPTKQQVPSAVNGYGSQTSATGDNLGQQNQTLVDNSDSPDGDIVAVSETDTFYNIDIYSEDDNSSLTATSQGPTKLDGSWDINSGSESSYGFNDDSSALSDSDLITQTIQGTAYDDFSQQNQTPFFNSGLYSAGETITNHSSSGNYTGHGTGNYSVGVNSTAAQGPKLGGDIFLSSNNSNSNNSSVPSHSYGSHGANVTHQNNPNRVSPTQYNCTGGSRPSVYSTESQGQSNESGYAVPTNNFVTKSPVASSNSAVDNNTFNSNVNGHGNSSSSTGYHTGENRGNSSNIFLGSFPPGGYGDSNSSHSMPQHNGHGYGNGSSSGNANIVHDPEHKPLLNKNNITEHGIYFDNGTSRSNSSTQNNGLVSPLMPSGVNNNGSKNGTNLSSSNPNITSSGENYTGSSNSNHSSINPSHSNNSYESISSNGNSDNLTVSSTGGHSNGSGNSSNVSSGSSSSGGYGNASHSMPTNNGVGFGSGSSSGNTSSTSNPDMKPPVSTYNATENGLSYGNGTNRSNSSTHNYGTNSNSSNPSMISTGGSSPNGSHSNPNITSGGGYIHNPNVMPPEGNNYGVHETDGSSHNFMPPEGSNYEEPHDDPSNPNHPYWSYDPNMLPPVVHGPPEGYFNGSSYSMHGTEGNSHSNNFMPPGGYSHGESNGNPNNSDSSSWNSYHNMPPPAIPGHYSNTGNTMSNPNGSNPYLLPPGLDGSNNRNYSNLIHILSNAMGLSPTDLSLRLKGADLSKPGSLVAVLSGIPGFDVNHVPPEVKAIIEQYSGSSSLNGYPNMPPPAVPGHYSIIGNTMSNPNGSNPYLPPPGLDGSNSRNYSNLIHILSNETGLSPTDLSQRLKGVDLSKPGSLVAVLSGIPGFDVNHVSPEVKAIIDNSHSYFNGQGVNYNMPPPKWDSSRYGNRENLIKIVSTSTGISPTLLTQKLNEVDISNPSSLANALSNIPGLDINRLPPDLRTAMVGYNSNVSHTFPNIPGYNSNKPPPNWNTLKLANNSYFLHVLSNMTNISTDVLSQKLNELKDDNQGNLTALLLSLPHFDQYRLPTEFREAIFGDGTNYNMMHPGSTFGNDSHYGNGWDTGSYNQDSSLPGNNAESDNSTTFYSGAASLRSKVGVMAIFFTITLLLLN